MHQNKDLAYFTVDRLTTVDRCHLLHRIWRYPMVPVMLKFQRWLRGFFLIVFYLCLLLPVGFLMITVVSFSAIVRVFWQTGEISWRVGEILWDWFWDRCEILHDEESLRLKP